MNTISAQQVKELRERSGAGMMECKKALVESQGDINMAMAWLRKSGLARADRKADRIAAEGCIISARKVNKAVLVEINCETDFVARDASFLKFGHIIADIALNPEITDIESLKAAPYPNGGSVEDAGKALIATIGEKIDVRRLVCIESEGIISSYVHGGRIGVLLALEKGSEALAKGIAMHVAAMNPRYVQAEDVPAAFLAKEKDIALGQMSEKDKAKSPEIREKIIDGKIRKIISEVTLLGQTYVMDNSLSVAEALNREDAKVTSVKRLAVGEGVAKTEENFATEVMKQAGLT